ncbi:uncharacterized protein RCC_03912 [Ramularia collo-cygni]|uniref:Phosphoglycerate mutase family protein n=1 Tax=Ramularia collo-cygni TaxID=112498 RepID=A0A2D3V6C4_9PEZI|nr:uncharacterized protein RCC_03912 [Ramularia collo-cygni]CZT18074.1 uncharacterized protein RCC_03912 [Ramularia collo-cygni]
MRRTLQTTLISLKWLVESGVPVAVDPMWQENSNEKCDTGLPIYKTASLFPSLDFSCVDPAYSDKSVGSPYAFSALANKARGEACLKALYERPEKVIIVVSHAGFLRTAITKRKFGNADYRIFTFGRGKRGYLELFEDEATEGKGGRGRSRRGIWKVKEGDFPLESIGEESDGEWFGVS